MEEVNPWAQVVSLLSVVTSATLSGAQSWHMNSRAQAVIRRDVARGSRPDTLYAGCNSKVTQIERQGNSSALVSWCDPTMCHYIDQVWNQAIARRSGYCALTGQRIERGNTIFKPRARGHRRPANCDEMILAAAVALTD